VAGSGEGRQWQAPLSVAVVALIVPLGVLVWQVFQLLPAPEPPRAAPAPVAQAEPIGPTPEPVPTPEAAPVAELVPVAEQVPPATAAPVEPVPAPAPLAEPPPPPATPPPPAISLPIQAPRLGSTGESSFNFVAVGVDRRNEREIPRTDTIMIGNVDLARPRLSLVSIPRDLLVDIPGYGQDRINAAYVYGEQYREGDGGIGLLRRTIEWNFSIPIHHFGLVDFQCFRTIVDAAGGITVDVPQPILDTRYPTEDYGYKTVSFETGPQRLDGERALEYARTRNPDNDLNRIRRQQQVVAALRQQLLQLRTLPALPTMMGGCRNMRSDLQLLDYLGLANAVRQFGEGDIAYWTIDDRMAVEGVAASGAWVLVPRWEPIRSLVRDAFPGSGVSAGIPAAKELDVRRAAFNAPR
jgi:LCP family protein required for cell wall assembly